MRIKQNLYPWKRGARLLGAPIRSGMPFGHFMLIEGSGITMVLVEIYPRASNSSWDFYLIFAQI